MGLRQVFQSLLGRRSEKQANEKTNNENSVHTFMVVYRGIGMTKNEMANEIFTTDSAFPTQEELRGIINHIRETNQYSYVLISNLIPLESF